MNIREIRQSAGVRSAPVCSAGGSFWRHGRALWQRIVEAGKRQHRSLRLCESLNLGERRFVAVIAYEHSRFLLGGTSGSLVLLTQLGNETEEGAAPDSIRGAHSSGEPGA